MTQQKPPPAVPLVVVLAEGLQAQIPGLADDVAARIAAGQAYDLVATGWVRAADAAAT